MWPLRSLRGLKFDTAAVPLAGGDFSLDQVSRSSSGAVNIGGALVAAQTVAPKADIQPSPSNVRYWR